MKIAVETHNLPPINVPIIRREQSEPLPEWLQKIVKKQLKYNERYEKAHTLISKAYNELLMEIDVVNEKFDTGFTFQQLVEEYNGDFAYEALDDEDDEDDEDEDDEDDDA